MDNLFYTYAWLREDGTPFYIGKGCKNRAWDFRGRRCKRNGPPARVLILKRNLSEAEAYKHEIYMIAVFGRKCNKTGILINLSAGGGGPTNLPPEKRSEMARKRCHRMPYPDRVALCRKNNQEKSYPIEVTLHSGEVKSYPSLRAAARELECDKNALVLVATGKQKKCKKFKSVRLSEQRNP
jgi:hypothetical protein